MFLTAGAMAAGMLLGASTGAALRWLRFPPVSCSLLAALLGCVLGSVVGAAARFKDPGADGIFALTLDLRAAAFFMLAIAACALFLHAGLGWAGSAVNPAFASYRGPTLGALGSLAGFTAVMMSTQTLR